MSEEVLRYKIQVDASEAQPVMQSMVSAVSNGVSGAVNTVDFASQAAGQTYESLKFGGQVTSQAVGASYGSLQGGMSQINNIRSQYQGGHSDQMYQGMEQAAESFHENNRNAGSSMATGAAYGALAIGGWTAVGGVSSAGWRTGSALGKGIFNKLGMGGINKIGGVALGLGGMMAPFMAVDAMVEKTMDDIQNVSKMSSAIGGYDERYRKSIDGPTRGSRFSRDDRNSMSRGIVETVNGLDQMNFGEGKMGIQGASQVLDGFSKEIFSDSNLTSSKFREVFAKKLKAVRDFSMTFDKSIKESVELMKSLGSMTGGAQDPRVTAALLGNASNASGLSTLGMVGVGQSSGNTYLQHGMTKQQGANTGIQNVADAGSLQQRGLISKNDAARSGGIKGMAAANTNLMAAFTAGPMGQMLISSSMDANGNIDASKIQGIISGERKIGEILASASNVASGGIGSLSHFMANKDKVSQQLTPAQQQGLVGAMAINAMEMSGMEKNVTNLQTVFATQMKMSQPMARMMANRIMNPGIYKDQVNTSYSKLMEKAVDAENSANTMSGWLYSKTIAPIGTAMNYIGTGMRRHIANRIGNTISAAGKKYQQTSDWMTGTTRLQIDADSSSVDSLMGRMRSRSEVAGDAQDNRSAAITNNFDKMVAAAQQISERGAELPDWASLIIRKYEIPERWAKGNDKSFDITKTGGLYLGQIGSVINKKDVNTMMRGYQRDTRIMKDLQMGQTSGTPDNSLYKNVNFLRGIDELISDNEKSSSLGWSLVGRNKTNLTSMDAARKLVSRGGFMGLKKGSTLADLSVDQRKQLGAAIAQSGISIDDRSDKLASMDFEVEALKVSQEQVNKAKAGLDGMFADRGWNVSGSIKTTGVFLGSLATGVAINSASAFNRLAGWKTPFTKWVDTEKVYRSASGPNIKSNPFEAVYGKGFTGIMKGQAAKKTRMDSVRLMAILSKGKNATGDDRKVAAAITGRLMKYRESLTGDQKRHLSKFIQDSQKFTAGAYGEMTPAIKDLGDDFRSKANTILTTMTNHQTILSRGIAGREAGKRFGIELASIKSQDKKAMMEDMVKKGGDLKQLEEISLAARGLGSGDIVKNMDGFADFSGEKYKKTMDYMRSRGGVYRKMADLSLRFSSARGLQGRDLLKDVADKDPVLQKLLSPNQMRGALKSGTQSRIQYQKIMKHMRAKNPKMVTEINKIDYIMGGLSSDKRRLQSLSKMIKGKEKGEGFSLANIVLADTAGKKAGTISSSANSAGTYSRMAALQIDAQQKVIRSLQTQYDSIKMLHDRITNNQ